MKRSSLMVGGVALLAATAGSMFSPSEIAAGEVRTTRGMIGKRELTASDIDHLRRAEEKRKRRAEKSRMVST